MSSSFKLRAKFNVLFIERVVYFSNYTYPLYYTSDLRQIRYTTHPTYQHVVLQLQYGLVAAAPAPQLDRYFSVHLTTNIEYQETSRMSTNLVYGRNGGLSGEKYRFHEGGGAEHPLAPQTDLWRMASKLTPNQIRLRASCYACQLVTSSPLRGEEGQPHQSLVRTTSRNPRPFNIIFFKCPILENKYIF